MKCQHLILAVMGLAMMSGGVAHAMPTEYDVIVAGGGPAGIGAGYMAAKRGAKTLYACHCLIGIVFTAHQSKCFTASALQ